MTADLRHLDDDEVGVIEDHCPECGEFESECSCEAQCRSCGKVVEAADLDALDECDECSRCDVCLAALDDCACES